MRKGVGECGKQKGNNRSERRGNKKKAAKKQRLRQKERRQKRFRFAVRLWWEEVDSNYRSRRRQIYSLIHLATLESSRVSKDTIYSVFFVFMPLNIGIWFYRDYSIRELLENY